MRGKGIHIAVLAVISMLSASDLLAQRPVQMFDPFCRGESAVRSFYDRYAVTAELSYRPNALLQGDASLSTQALGTDAIGLNLHLEYQLNANLDLGMYVDARGNAAGQGLGFSWIVLKYMSYQEGTDYAIRLAIDPSSDGRSGFPQADLAFLYSSPMSDRVTADFGFGVRRVQIGFQELVPATPEGIDPGSSMVSPPGASNDILRGRARGWEVHATWSHNILFDPAGSNLFVSLMAEAGSYDMLEWIVQPEGDQDSRTQTDYRGGVLWARSGLEIERPAYRFAPFLDLPFRQWAPSTGEWPRSKVRLGVRLMLR